MYFSWHVVYVEQCLQCPDGTALVSCCMYPHFSIRRTAWSTSCNAQGHAVYLAACGVTALRPLCVCGRWCVTYKAKTGSIGRHGCFGILHNDAIQPTVVTRPEPHNLEVGAQQPWCWMDWCTAIRLVLNASTDCNNPGWACWTAVQQASMAAQWHCPVHAGQGQWVLAA